MQASITPEPQVVSQDEWLAERMKLLLDEQELTKHRDRPRAGLRNRPMDRTGQRTKRYRSGQMIPKTAAGNSATAAAQRHP